MQRAIRQPAVEQRALLEEFDEDSWPSGVTVALLSHSTWMRPANDLPNRRIRRIQGFRNGQSAAGAGG
jgi:hypothetical protein